MRSRNSMSWILWKILRRGSLGREKSMFMVLFINGVTANRLQPICASGNVTRRVIQSRIAANEN